jgi:Rod binding domain-containing protein
MTAAAPAPPSASGPPLPPALPVATSQQKAKVAKVAHDFEASFLQVMMGEMFAGVSGGAFDGGEGEAAFKSFLTDAYAKAMVNHGGLGLSKHLTHELLKMQGLDPNS